MRKKKVFVLTAVFLTIITILLTGCGDSKGKSNEGAKPVTLTVLTDSSPGWIRNFNPYTNPRHVTQGFIHEYLVIFNEMQNNKEIPWLAEEIITEPDLQTITIKTREGVKWSDGKPFSAEDVAFTFNYSRDHPEIDFTGNWGETGKMESVTAIDNRTVVIKMREKNAFHRNDIFDQFMIVPKHVWEKIDLPASAVIETPVGTGPFTEVVSFSPQLFIMGRNPHYWKGSELKIDQIKYPQFNGNEAAFDILKTGKIDWAEFFIPKIEKVYVQGDEHRKYWFPPNDGVRITVNFQTKNKNNRKAFENINFRRAFLMSLDRKAMMEVGAYGYVQGNNNGTNLPSGLAGWRNPEADEIWKKYFKYDIQAAQKELADGGFKDVDGDGYVENPDGTPIKFDILVPSGWTDWVNNCSIAVEGLRKAGIHANVRTPEVQSYIDVWQTGEHDAIFGATINRSTVWKFYYDVVHSRNNNSNTWWTSTMNNYSNSKLDRLVETMPLTLDEHEHKRVSNEIEKYYAKNILHFPLYYNAQWFQYNTSRFTGWPNEDNKYIAPVLGNHDNKLILLLNLKPIS